MRVVSAQMVESAVRSELAPLHRLLGRIGRKRQRLRLTIGILGVLVGLIFVALGLFTLDWLLGLTIAQRVVLILVAIIVAYVASRRFILPWFIGRESELDLALLVQKHFGIDSDLVAALQFEYPEAVEWGSVELEQKVIRQVAAQAQQLPLIEDVPRAPLRKRLLASLCGVTLVTALVLLFPEHVAVFVKRLMLQNVHYPTATRIIDLSVNGQPVSWDKAGQTLRCGVGATVDIRVVATGRLPEQGQALFQIVDQRRNLRIPLVPVENQPADSPAVQRAFSGKWTGLDAPCRVRMTLGDATSQWIELSVVPPPVVLTWFAFQDPLSENPEYTMAVGNLQISVREGTQVIVGLASRSELKHAVATIGLLEVPLQRGIPQHLEGLLSAISQGAAASIPQTSGPINSRLPSASEFWWLDPAGTPLERVESPIRIRFQVQDQFGLEPSVPVEAFVGVRPDYPPQIAVRTVTRLVLPTAQPTIFVEARDDLGLREVRALGKVVQADGEEGGQYEWVLWQGNGPPTRTLNEKYKVDLSQLKAKKGDKIELTVVAEDERGSDRPGAVTQADAIFLEVTDLAGILAVMAEADRESAAQLQEMIDRQLDVGGEQ